MAARKRSRKITEKRQELSKLIPGGQKLNTAEMFQAASKYIRFLQAQVGIFELMRPNQGYIVDTWQEAGTIFKFYCQRNRNKDLCCVSVQEKKEAFQSEQLQHLVASPLTRELLFGRELFGSQQFVQLVNEPEIKTNPSFSRTSIN